MTSDIQITFRFLKIVKTVIYDIKVTCIACDFMGYEYDIIVFLWLKNLIKYQLFEALWKESFLIWMLDVITLSQEGCVICCTTVQTLQSPTRSQGKRMGNCISIGGITFQFLLPVKSVPFQYYLRNKC